MNDDFYLCKKSVHNASAYLKYFEDQLQYSLHLLKRREERKEGERREGGEGEEKDTIKV